MKFSCEKYLIQQAVYIASRCTASKSPIPALEGLLIEAGNDVKITGYDLKKGIYTNFPADVAEPGAIVLNSRLFGEIVRSLPDGIVSLNIEKNNIVEIKCGDAEFSLIGTDSGEFPELPAVEKENAISVPQDILGKMLRQTIFAVSDNESRPIYTGALFEVENDELVIVAVDGFRLSLRRERVKTGSLESCRFIVPGTALSDVEKLCTDSEGTADITVGAKHVSFVIGSTVLISRRLEGEFLNYKKSVPTEFAIVMEVARENLLRSVSRVSLVIDEKMKNPLKVFVGPEFVNVSCTTGIGSGEDRCPAKMKEGQAVLTIGLNNRYLLDVLKAAPDDMIRIGLNNANSPCVIFPSEGDGFAYMILPVRLRV